MYLGNGFIEVLAQNYLCVWVSVETRSAVFSIRLWPGGKIQRLKNWCVLVLPSDMQKWSQREDIKTLEHAFAHMQKDLALYVDSDGQDVGAYARAREALERFQ